MEIQLSPDQKQVLTGISDWLKSEQRLPYLTIGGYAGTGKTTLIGILRRLLHKKNPKLKVAFCSYTGKAALVLKSNLAQADAIYKQDQVSTIHGLIYTPEINSREEIIGWELKDDVDFDLIIVDEASMVDQNIWSDLLSYHIPIIAVGDHGQLPPIRGKFNLMDEPQLRLENIHRQAEGNPIIRLSILARKEGQIPIGKYSDHVVKYNQQDADSREHVNDILQTYNRETLVLCGYNHTRVELNNFIRTSLGKDEPMPTNGDRLICLRNNHIKEVYNGMIGTVNNIRPEEEDWYFAEVDMDAGNRYEGLLYALQFGAKAQVNFSEDRALAKKGDLFDFGYALTVHKAQGSQARRVVLFEERFSRMDDEDWRRWLYTGVTRAQEELFLIGS